MARLRQFKFAKVKNPVIKSGQIWASMNKIDFIFFTYQYLLKLDSFEGYMNNWNLKREIIFVQ
jgi:hypothetical protein